MDVNDFRNVVTLLSFVLFAGIVKWALSRRNRERFDDAARLPFLDEDGVPPRMRPQMRAETRHE